MFIPWFHTGPACVECYKDIRVLLYSDGQSKRTAGMITSLRTLHRLLVKNIDGATSFIRRMEWETSYSSSFYRHPEHMCGKHWLLRWLAAIWSRQQRLYIYIGQVRTTQSRRAHSCFHHRCIFAHKMYSRKTGNKYLLWFVVQTGVHHNTNAERVEHYLMSSGYLDEAYNMVNRMLLVSQRFVPWPTYGA